MFTAGISIVHEGERYTLEWGEDEDPAEQAEWLESVVAEHFGLTPDRLRALIKKSSGGEGVSDREQAAARATCVQLQEDLWYLVCGATPEEGVVESPVETVGAAALEDTVQVPGGADDAADAERGVAAVVESIRQDLFELAAQTAVLPATYYAHINAQRLLTNMAPELESQLEGLRQGQAVNVFIDIMTELSRRELRGNAAARARPQCEALLRLRASAGIVSINGYSRQEMLRLQQFPNLARRFSEADSKAVRHLSDDKDLACKDIIQAALTERDVSPFSDIDTYIEQLPPELGEELAACILDSGAKELITQSQRRFLKWAFPRRVEKINTLASGDLKPLVMSMVGAVTMAWQRQRSKSAHPVALEIAEVFIPCFFSTPLDELADEMGYRHVRVSRAVTTFVHLLKASEPVSPRTPPSLIDSVCSLPYVWERFTYPLTRL